ncbi:MAG: bacterial Ig-like domain-containing protein [Clostridia bacterium]|nr:bacterial Ig-like domain-containing protein [Clostridia bacterium]
MIKKKMLSLFLVLTTLMPAVGSMTIAASAENEDMYAGTSDVVLTLQQYDDALAAISGGGNEAEFAKDEKFVNILLRRQLVDKAGYETLMKKMIESPEFKECIEWLFTDTEMLRYYVYGGEPESNSLRQKHRPVTSGTYMSSFNVLTSIYTKHKEDLNDPEFASLYKRMMASIALTHSVTIYDWFLVYEFVLSRKWVHTSEPVGRYELFKKLRKHNMLAEEFDRYSVEDMRLVMCAPIDNAQLEWMHHYYRVKFLNNADYATRVVPASGANVGGACGMPYTTYSQDPFQPGSAGMYDPAQYDKWNEKYMLKVKDDIFDYSVDYGFNEKGLWYHPLWGNLERGGVCSNISFVGTILRNSFGLACHYLYQAPDHMSFMPYTLNTSGQVICGNGYNAYGMAKSGLSDRGNGYLPGGWSNYSFVGDINAGYMFIGAEAVHNNRNTDYEKAENLIYLAQVRSSKGEYEAAEALYEEALKAQYFNFGVYIGLFDLYKKMGKEDSDYYSLAKRAAENLKWYPMPMHDYIMKVISPVISNQVMKADLIGIVFDTLTEGTGAYANSGLWQPGYCREIAGSLRWGLTKIASFSFNTNTITLNGAFRTTGKDFLYSFDGGTTWNRQEYSEGAASFALTDEEVAQITDAKDILYKFDTAEKTHTIYIGTAGRPTQNATTNVFNDDEDKILRLQGGLEYSIDDGTTWHNLTADCIFEGNITVLIRVKATGANLAGPHITMTFTEAVGEPERRYLRLSNNVKLVSYPAGMNGKTAQNALDGNMATYWENMYTRAYKRDPDYPNEYKWIADDNNEFVFEITEPHYISALGYIPVNSDGMIKACEVYFSNDNKEWHLAGSAQQWTYVKGTNDPYPREQSIDFSEPVYAKYIKIKTTQIGRKNFNNFLYGYALATEFRLYENVTCSKKEIASLDLSTDRTSYKVGDKLDTGSISARLLYADGTKSIVPSSELAYGKDIFSEAGELAVDAEYNGIKSSFAVNVSENDRTATAISAVTASDRIYYAGDLFGKEDAVVKVTDGSDSWYLLPHEFTLQNDLLAEGKNTVTVLHNGITSTVSVNAEKAAKAMRIDTDESFRMNYSIGDEISFEGMSVKLIYEDDTEKALTDADYKTELLDGETIVSAEEFTRTAGMRKIRVTLNNKSEISTSIDITVFPYITSGEFSFEAIEGKAECKMTRFNPETDLAGRTVEIPETVTVGGHLYTVTEIAGGAFASAPEVEAVSVPKTVKTIGSGAFSTCTALKKIYMVDHTSFDGFICEEGAFETVENGLVYLDDAVKPESSPIPGYEIANALHTATEIVVTPPKKTEYVLGDELDCTGMTVTAILEDGGNLPIHAYTVSGYEPYATGEQTVTVTLNGISLSNTFTVNVGFPEIIIEQSPTGAVYAPDSVKEPMSVTAWVHNDNTLLYQWYRSNTSEKNGAAVEGATAAEFIPQEPGYYYAAVWVSDKNGNASEKVYSEAARVMIGDFEASIGITGYETFKDAAAAAVDKSVIYLRKDIEINDGAQITGAKKVIIDGGGHTIRRGSGFGEFFIAVKDQGTAVTLQNITFDGGAVWTGDEDAVTKRGMTNSGLQAVCPLIIAYDGTEVTLSDGAVLQNNYNKSGAANVQDSYDIRNITGGAIWTRSATVNLSGGIIRNNASEMFGSAMYMRGASVLTSYDGEVSGNHDPNPASQFNASAICLDNDTTATIQNGSFINNKGGAYGGVFWIGNGSIIINGGLFENNYTTKEGGVGFFYQGAKVGTLNVNGGIFRNNRADEKGGVFYCDKYAVVKNALFENNSAGLDGGVFRTLNGGLNISESTFKNNTANYGGAIWAGNTISLSGGSFAGNTAAQKGNAAYIDNAKRLSVGNVCDFGEEQDICQRTFVPVNITGMSNTGKAMYLTSVTEIVTGTVIANVSYDQKMDIRINGYKSVYEPSGTKWVLKAVVPPAAYRVERKDDGVHVLSPEAGEVTVVFAAYNEDNSLAGIESIPVVFEEAGEQIVNPANPDMLSGKKVKVMILDSLNGLTPKCTYYETTSF